MFIETVTLARAQAEAVWEHSRIFSEPPDGLMAAIAWETGAGEVTSVMTWETPAARGDFAMERMMPLYESGTLGEEHGHPQPVTAVNVFLRT